MSKKKHKASCKHCRTNPECCADARRVDSIGFARPSSVTVSTIQPRGITSQAWETWYWEDEG